MENKENEFELVPVYDKDSGTYVINNFEKCKSVVQAFITECHLDLVITSEEDFKGVKATRTNIRKKKETVATARKQIKEMLVGTFEAQLKEIETMLGEADTKLKVKVDAWEAENKNKAAAPKIITLTIKGYDLKKIEKIKESAIKQNLEAVIKF